MDVLIGEGWPIPEQLDLDLAGQTAPPTSGGTPGIRPNGPRPNVTIFPLPGASKAPYQILDKTYTISSPVYGLSVSSSSGGDTITVSGTPNTGEFLTLVCDGGVVFSEGGSSVAAVLESLASAASGTYPLTSVTASGTSGSLTIPVEHSLVVRQGGTGLRAKVTHRQCHAVMVTVWAPDPGTRSTLAAAIDNSIKQTLVVTLPDTSDALIRYLYTSVTDDAQNVTVYRRDLVYEVEFATLETFAATEITAVTTVISGGEGPHPTSAPPVSAIT